MLSSLSGLCWRKEQRGREVLNISSCAHQKTSVQRLVALPGREEHWTLNFLNLVVIQGVMFKDVKFLFARTD